MPERSSRDFRSLWPWSLCALVAVLSIACVELVAPQNHVSDFASYYFAAAGAAAGRDIYSAHAAHHVYPYMYPPFLATILRPLTWFSMETALVIWNSLQVALAGVALWLTSRILRRCALPATWPVVVASLLCAWLFVLNVLWAQANVLVICLALLAAWLMLSSRALLAGVVLGVAVSIKVTPVCVLLVASLLPPRDIAAVVTSCAATVLACCLLVPAMLVDFAWALQMNAHFIQFSQQSAMGAVDALPFGNNRLNQSLTFHYGAWAVALPLAAAAVTAWGTRRRVRPAAAPIAVAQAFVLTPLITPIAWGHHWFALLPAVAIVTALRRQHPILMFAWLALALVALLPFFVGELPASAVPALALLAAMLLAAAAVVVRK